ALPRGVAALEELRVLLRKTCRQPHRRMPPVGDRRQPRVERGAQARDQTRQWIAEILVLALAEAMPRHHHAAAKTLLDGIERGQLIALCTGDELLDHRVAAGLEVIHFARLGGARAFRTPLLAPLPIFLRQAYRAGVKAGGARVSLVAEEHAVFHVAATGDGAQRGRTVETPVNPGSAMAAQGSPALLHPCRSRSRRWRAAAAKACMFSRRPVLPVWRVTALSLRPLTARQTWPAGSP